ncbi:MAG: tetratricopeptide repeat protein, partial [Holophagales bacterium]|nr:tetratricopeptide repeat protein [Holophagales bacterium]
MAASSLSCFPEASVPPAGEPAADDSPISVFDQLTPETEPVVAELVPGEPHQGELWEPDSAIVEISTEAGRWLVARLASAGGGDGKLGLESADGELLLGVDEAWNGREETLIHGPLEAGRLRLRVRPIEHLRYTLWIDLPEKPAPRQEAWARAQRLRHEGQQAADPSKLEQAGREWLELREGERAVLAWTEAAEHAASSGNREQALDLYFRSLVQLQELEPAYPGWHAATLNRRGLVYRRLGRLALAEADFRAARELAGAVFHKSAHAAAVNNLALLRQDEGRFDAAQQLYERAIEILGEPSGRQLRREQGTYLENLARLQTIQGRPAAAALSLRRARELFEGARDQVGLARVDSERAWQHLVADRPREALALVERAAPILEAAAPSSISAMVAQQRSGIALEELGRILEARAAYSRAESIARRGKHSRAALGLGITWCRLAAENSETSLDRPCEGAIAELRQAGNPNLLSSGLYWWARRLSDLEELDRALEVASEASSLLEPLRVSIAGSDSRARFFEARGDVHRLIVEILMHLHRRAGEPGFARRALETSDALRARSALDLLGRALDAGADAGAAPSSRIERLENELVDRDRIRQRDLARGLDQGDAELERISRQLELE